MHIQGRLVFSRVCFHIRENIGSGLVDESTDRRINQEVEVDGEKGGCPVRGDRRDAQAQLTL
jgi:hypothetical protein